MRRKFIIIIGLTMAVAGLYLFFHTRSQKIVLGGETFFVEVAATPQIRGRGLSGRRSLAPDRGMLFRYHTRDRYGFWMKDMRFPLDILWLSSLDAQTSEIVDIAPSAPPDASDSPRVYEPRLPADDVLELTAGTAARLHLKIGDRAEFP